MLTLPNIGNAILDYIINMTLNASIPAKVMRSGLEQTSSVLEAHLFQYLESEIKSAMDRETTRETVTSNWIWEMTSGGNDVCTFEIAATKLI
jgi:hypothetical protein